jgi:hypothetical protein
MAYTTYENRVNPHITIHVDTCNQIKKHGGVGIGEYRYHNTLDEAKIYAMNTTLKIIECSFCKP